MTRTHYQESALMRKQISTLALTAALIAVAFVSLPSEALAQHGHHYGHGYGHGYSHGYGGYGYGVRRQTNPDHCGCVARETSCRFAAWCGVL